MRNLCVLLYQFYRPLFLWNLLLSGAGITFLFIYGTGYLLVSFSFKYLGYASAVALQYMFSANEYYYYRNAGYAVRRLYVYTFLIDFAFYLLLVYIFTLIKPLLYA